MLSGSCSLNNSAFKRTCRKIVVGEDIHVTDNEYQKWPLLLNNFWKGKVQNRTSPVKLGVGGESDI